VTGRHRATKQKLPPRYRTLSLQRTSYLCVTLLCCAHYIFSVLCVYSMFGHHPHPLGYLCAKFCFCRILNHSIIHSFTQLIWCAGNWNFRFRIDHIHSIYYSPQPTVYIWLDSRTRHGTDCAVLKCKTVKLLQTFASWQMHFKGAASCPTALGTLCGQMTFWLASCCEHYAVMATELLQPQDLSCGTLFWSSCAI